MISRLELHVAAFSPLYAMLAWRLWGRGWGWLFLALAVLGVSTMLLTLWGASRQQSEPVVFEDITDVGDQVADQVVGYLLPLIIGPEAETSELLVTMGVLVILGLILVQSNRIHLNPVLFVLGYRVYTATARGKAFYLIARSDLSTLDGPLLVAEVPGGLLVEKRRRR